MRRRAVIGFLALAALPAPARASSEKADPKKRSGGVSYLPMAAITGATNKPGGRRGVLSVECGLDVPDANLRIRVEQSLPRLRAAYVQIVTVYAAGLPSGAPPNADFLGRNLQSQTDSVLGKPGARLLLGAILVN